MLKVYIYIYMYTFADTTETTSALMWQSRPPSRPFTLSAIRGIHVGTLLFGTFSIYIITYVYIRRNKRDLHERGRVASLPALFLNILTYISNTFSETKETTPGLTWQSRPFSRPFSLSGDQGHPCRGPSFWHFY